MLLLAALLAIAFTSRNNIIYTCDKEPYQGVLVVAVGSFLSASNEQGVNWSPTEIKGQMIFNRTICRYTKAVQGLPTYTNYEWKVAFNGKWGGDKGYNNNNNCQFSSSASGAVLLIYNPYNGQLTTSPLCTNQSIVPSTSTSPPSGVCGDGQCQSNENHQTCPQDCPDDLPGCDVFSAESCQSGTQFHANPGVDAKRWQTPQSGTKGYQPPYQGYYILVGYADIIYTDTVRRSANVCLETIYRYNNSVTFTYLFDNAPQTTKCKLFTNTYTGILTTAVVASDNSILKLPEIDFIWNAKPLVNRSGDYRNGQKGAVAEMFGWPHGDIKDECEFLSKAGYLGVKVFPMHEQLMSTQPMENVMNPWYFMYQPASYNLDGRIGTREELRSRSYMARTIMMWDGLYPKEAVNNPLISRHRVVIQNDDHDQQSPGSSSRDMGDDGGVLVKNCPIPEHRHFEMRLFSNPKGVVNNSEDWPIRFVLSSFYHTYGDLGIPDGKSLCDLCTVSCDTCHESVPYKKAHDPTVCGYAGTDYTRTHRDIAIINAMRAWINLATVTGADLGIPQCT